MRYIKENSQLTVMTDRYDCRYDLEQFTWEFWSGGSCYYCGNIGSAVHTLEAPDEERACSFVGIEETKGEIILRFAQDSVIWENKQLVFRCRKDDMTYGISVENGTGSDRILSVEYFKRSGDWENTWGRREQRFYSPRFDWCKDVVFHRIDENDLLSCQQWLSPPPFCFAVETEQGYCGIGVAAGEGENNYISYEHVGSGHYFKLNMEGHCKAEGRCEVPELVFTGNKADGNEAVEEYIRYLREEKYVPSISEKQIPDWWREPLFCGWGEMRYEYRKDHDGHENDNFINVTDYCTQKRYEEYIKTLEDYEVNPGTVIIDMGWAQNPALGRPDPHKWPDMRSFIDREHQKGRHVLLWFTPVVTQGLSDGLCLRLDGRAVAPDPGNPAYASLLEQEIRQMLSEAPGCLNADGFKIDFTQNTPSEDGVFRSYINSFWGLVNQTNEKHIYAPLKDRNSLISGCEEIWGVELLKRYLKNIYTAMKTVKPDSLLITHTPNPYFADVSDMLRLNDLDGESDNVLGIMNNRARIARMGCSQWLIDTDNDLMINKGRWRDYIKLQEQIGVPDTYYASHIAASGETFETEDYRLLKDVFQHYRMTLKSCSGG